MKLAISIFMLLMSIPLFAQIRTSGGAGGVQDGNDAFRFLPYSDFEDPSIGNGSGLDMNDLKNTGLLTTPEKFQVLEKHLIIVALKCNQSFDGKIKPHVMDYYMKFSLIQSVKTLNKPLSPNNCDLDDCLYSRDLQVIMYHINGDSKSSAYLQKRFGIAQDVAENIISFFLNNNSEKENERKKIPTNPNRDKSRSR